MDLGATDCSWKQLVFALGKSIFSKNGGGQVGMAVNDGTSNPEYGASLPKSQTTGKMKFEYKKDCKVPCHIATKG